MQYKDVVKAMFAKYKGKMPAKDIMKMAAAEYRKMGGASAGGKAKGGSFDMTSLMSGLFGMGLDDAPAAGAMSAGAIRRRGRKAKVRGAGVIGDVASPFVNVADSIGSLFGLGLDDAPAAGAMSAGAMRRRGRKAKVRGAGVIGDVANPIVNVADSIGSLFGFGLDDAPAAGAMSAGAMRRGRKAKVRGAGVISDVASPFVDVADSIGSLFGLGLEKKKGKKKGGYLSAGALSGGEFPIAHGSIEPQGMTVGDNAFSTVPFQPQMLTQTGGNLGSIAKFLPLLALV